MEKQELLKVSKELIECCDSYYLSTFNKKYNSAETRAMANVRSSEIYPKNTNLFEEGDLSNYIITAMSSNKITQLKENKIVSLYFFCPKIGKSLTLFGTTEMIFDKEVKNKLWEDNWAEYFPLGKDDPEYTVIKFIPKTVKYFPDQMSKVVMEL